MRGSTDTRMYGCHACNRMCKASGTSTHIYSNMVSHVCVYIYIYNWYVVLFGEARQNKAVSE